MRKTSLFLLPIVAMTHPIDQQGEVGPVQTTKYGTCIDCIYQTNHYWCPATQRCYAYDGLLASLEGSDCTRPADYLEQKTWSVPEVYQFTKDVFKACMTTYEDFPSTNSISKVVSDCAFTFNTRTGQKVMNQPARLIIDDSYLKSDEMPNGSIKHY